MSIEVRNRKLEAFYYAHGVDFISCDKDMADGLTVWTYEDNAGQTRYITEIHVEEMELLGGQRREQAPAPEPEYYAPGGYAGPDMPENI